MKKKHVIRVRIDLCLRTETQEMKILSEEVTIDIIQEVIFNPHAKNFTGKIINISLHLKTSKRSTTTL